MTLLLYVIVWIALACFAAGEAGKRQLRRGELRSPWPQRLWTLGAVLMAIHAVLAFETHYGWSHRAAVSVTATRSLEMYGLNWGGGVYVNYLFIAVWLVDAAWWHLDPHTYVQRPKWMDWTWRAFSLVIIINAAVIFATPPGRILGVALLGALAWYWRPPGNEASES